VKHTAHSERFVTGQCDDRPFFIHPQSLGGRMTRSLWLAIATVTALAACSKPNVATCSQNSDCPRDAICVTGICQKGVPSGGAANLVGGSATLKAGTLTLDATVGDPMPPTGAAGTRTLSPATNTR
jgi:hypothetical protein